MDEPVSSAVRRIEPRTSEDTYPKAGAAKQAVMPQQILVAVDVREQRSLCCENRRA
jgi:hypothetical protein